MKFRSRLLYPAVGYRQDKHHVSNMATATVTVNGHQNGDHESSNPPSITLQPSSCLRTAYRLLQAYSSLSVDEILAPLAETFSHEVLPSSLGMPKRDRAAFAGHAAGITSVFSSFTMVPKSVFEDAAQKTVVVRCGMVGQLKPELADEDGGRSWLNECMMVLRMGGEGHEIVEIKEFVDSKKAMEMKERITKGRGSGEGTKVMDG